MDGVVQDGNEVSVNRMSLLVFGVNSLHGGGVPTLTPANSMHE